MFFLAETKTEGKKIIFVRTTNGFHYYIAKIECIDFIKFKLIQFPVYRFSWQLNNKVTVLCFKAEIKYNIEAKTPVIPSVVPIVVRLRHVIEMSVVTGHLRRY